MYVVCNLIKINSIGPGAQKKQSSQIEPVNGGDNFFYFHGKFFGTYLKNIGSFNLNLIKLRSRCPEKAPSQIEPGNGRHNV